MILPENNSFCNTFTVQGSAKRRAPGLVRFVPAVACHFCLALPAAFTQPGAHLLADPFIEKGDCEIERGSEKGERERMRVTQQHCFDGNKRQTLPQQQEQQQLDRC